MKTIYFYRIRETVGCWTTDIEKQGDYKEKTRYL